MRRVSSLGLYFLAVFLLLLTFASGSLANPPVSLAPTPPMGWNSWPTFRCNITEQKVRANADRLISSGLASLGYRYVNVDACWEANRRDRAGNLQPNPQTFPSGMAALGHYLHARGLKFGIYSSAGPTICSHPQPGSYGHYLQDMRRFASWGVDYVKVDWCSAPPHETPQQAYAALHQAVRKAGRRMIMTVSTPGTHLPWIWADQDASLWRIAADDNGGWPGVMNSLDHDAPLWRYAHPGAWNDPDMLQVGMGILSYTEERSHMSLWAMLASPLLIGSDVTQITPSSESILANPEIVAVDQDRLGRQGFRIGSSGGVETWVRPLTGNRLALLLLNRSGRPVQAALPKGASQAGRYRARDLWTHQTANLAVPASLEAHGAGIWVLTPLGHSAGTRLPSWTRPAAPASGLGNRSHAHRAG